MIHFIRSSYFPPDNVETLSNSRLIVNATTMGMFPDVEDTITDLEESFNEEQIVFDLVYNPTKTNFLKMAEMQGAKVVGGLKMLISQAAKSLSCGQVSRCLLKKFQILFKSIFSRKVNKKIFCY